MKISKGIEKMSKAVIITSFIESEIDITRHIRNDSFVICTDGGYDIASAHGIKPDLLLGDFDSIESELPKNVKIERFSPEKDYTDLDLALKTAVSSGSDDVTILGGIGGRLDHTVANLQLLYHYNKYFSSLTMLDGMNRCFILDSEKDGAISIPREEGSYLSVFSLSERSHGVTIEGAKYEISDHTLSRDFPLGVSNEFKEKNTVISVNDGILLIVISMMD